MKQITKENLSSGSIGIVIILTFLLGFIFILYGQTERFYLLLLTGIILLFSLTTIHIKILKYPIKKALLSIFSGTAIGLLFFFVYILILGGPNYFENQPASYEYTIKVKGLSNYNGSLVTDIIVPIPMKNGKQIFTDEEMQYQSFGIWTSILVVTKQGKMLAFQTGNTNLTDIDAIFKKDLNYSIDEKDVMQDALLHPVSYDITANYTIWIYGDKIQNYSTFVYTDPNLQSRKGYNNTITYNLGFTVRNGIVHGIARNTYRVDVFEVIPEDIKGPIPVKAQIAIMGDTGWNSFIPDN
jgi:hypothetical protein